MRCPRTPLVALAAALALGGCAKSTKSAAEEALAPLDDAALAALPPETQYAVANTLLGTLYGGVAPRDFFDLTGGTSPLVVGAGKGILARTREALARPLADRATVLALIDQRYDFDDGPKPLEYPLAMLWELPLSRDAFDVWMAYTLASTILFSPAAELETVDWTDVQKVMYRLDLAIRQDAPIRQIVYDHMTSQENWRRFRSPEDNTREMMEIFLGHFVDAEVPRAALACRNWSLSDESQGYQLVIGYDENAQPQAVLGTTVTSCYDFYRAVAAHADLLPTVARTLVRRFFPLAGADEQAALADALVAAGPTTFRQLFTTLLFSRQHLLRTTRTRSLEETFLNVAHRIPWVASRSFFASLSRPPDWWSGIETLNQMKQSPFRYKLGRREIPLDSLSFAAYHRAVRTRLLVDRRTSTDDWDGGWMPDLYQAHTLQGDAYLDFLFLSVVSRRPSASEATALKAVFAARGYADPARRREQAMVALDYLSRLPELYVISAVQ
jgi:hypothetical protein